MKTVLSPTDFSSVSIHAAKFAISLAQMIGAKVVFINIIQPLADSFNLAMSSSQLMIATEEAAEMAMKKFKENLLADYEGNKANFPFIESKVVYGKTSSTIIDVADDLAVDYIVIGSTGSDNLTGKFFGSNSVRVAKNAHCPVWIIPQQVKLLSMKSIVYLTDLEGDDVELIDKVIDIAEILGANVKAIHIHGENEPELFSSKEIISLIKKDFKDKPVVFKNLFSTDVVEGIDTYIKNQHPDLVVIAHEEKSLFEKLFHQSVIKHLTLTSHKPLLVLQKKM